MKLFIIIVVCLIIITYYFYQIDGFTNIEPDIAQKYQKFISFYNPFLVSWEKAIITSIGLDTPVQPLTSPSQVSKASFTQPSRAEMNQYIQKLIKTMGKPLPLLTDPLPDTINPDMIEGIMNTIPMKSSIYKNALDWMNNGLETAQQELQAMKKQPEGFDDTGKYHTVESFEDCSQISKCLDAREAAKMQKEKDRQNEFGRALDECNNNVELQGALQKNQELVKKAKIIQDQAQSGDLLNQMNLGGKDPKTYYVLPKGAKYLEDMERDDPEKYNSYKENDKQSFYMAQYTNDINRNLR